MCDWGLYVVLVDKFLSCDTGAFVAGRYIASSPDCAKQSIPECEEWLREIGLYPIKTNRLSQTWETYLDAPTLVVHIMVSRIV